jgi:hypothetical protein
MGALSSLDRIGQIRSALGDPSSDDVTDEEIAGYLALAERQIALLAKPTELYSYEDVTTVASAADVEMTTARADVLAFLEPANNTSNNNFPMDMMDADWDRQQGMYLSQESEPWYWLPIGVGSNGRYNIRFRPIPDDAYVIRIPFIKTPTEPDFVDGSISDLSVAHEKAGVSIAIQIGLEFNNLRSEAMSQQKLAQIAEFIAEKTVPVTTTHKHHPRNFSDLLRRR